MTLVLGLNSGSSFDGIDAVIIDIANAADGYPGRPRFVDGLTHAWPEAVGKRVRKARAWRSTAGAGRSSCSASASRASGASPGSGPGIPRPPGPSSSA